MAEVLLHRLSILSRQLKSIELPHGMTQERLSALATISNHGKISVSALAAEENVRTATMSRMVSSLWNDGLIRRLEDKTDGRGVLVTMTAKGKRAFDHATKRSVAQLTAALAELEPSQIAALHALTSAIESAQSAKN
jgi:DNA-binding MarR family transcriptional regulator